MSSLLSEAITPWILGTLFLLALLAFSIVIKSWRDTKRSPYFFLRRQAEQRLQTYLLASLGLTVAITVTAVYTWQPPTDNTPRIALLTNAKPPEEDVVALMEALPESTEVTAGEALETAAVDTSSTVDTQADLATLNDAPLFVALALPEQFDQFEPTVELEEDTDIGFLVFSTDINSNYQAINPADLFVEGFYTLYATFDYASMANGMEWAWVWRLDGKVVDGGNELWQYGDDGPGYIYYNPEEGFQRGQYSLEVWVNGELLSQSAVIMNTAAVTAGN